MSLLLSLLSSSGGGGATSFDQITSGTNTDAAMAVGAGATLQTVNPVIGTPFSANSGAAITIDFANGNLQIITLTANTIITLPTAIAAGKDEDITLYLKQDGTGGRAVTFVNARYATTNPPPIAQAIGAYTYLGVINAPTIGCTVFAVGQNIGVSNGTNAAVGQIGEFITSSVASGSAVSAPADQSTVVTSITLTAGDWDFNGVAIFSGANLLQASDVEVFIGTAAGNNTTGQDTAVNTAFLTIPAFSQTESGKVNWRQNITSTTTYYLKVKIVGSSATGVTAFGSISARRSANQG